MSDPIAEMLLERGVVSADELAVARAEARRGGVALERAVVELGFAAEGAVRELRGAHGGHRTVDLDEAVADPSALRRLPAELARRCRVVPLAFDGEAGRLLLAAADLEDLAALDRVRAHLAGVEPEWVLAGEEALRRTVERFYGRELTVDGILGELEGEGRREGAGWEEDARHPLVRLADALLAEAVAAEASDIHLQPERGYVRIRHRLDGVLHTARRLHGAHWPALAVRLKVMAGLDIAESRAPQDGRFSRTVHGRPFDFRVSILPTLHGENIVLRLLDRDRGIRPLAALGAGEGALADLARMTAAPEGMILVAGPTGSGKSTTLYSLIHALDRDGLNVMTLEEPVEVPLAGIRQTSLGDGVKLDFAGGVRALLRQDPDVLLVGEIRDWETAEMALRASLTGHRLYATLHANSAPAALSRLAGLGLGAPLLAGSLRGVLAQRLVRRLCPECREPYAADAGERERFGADQLWRPRGCAACRGTGYRGRLPLMEALVVDETLEALLAADRPVAEIRRAALERGYRPLVLHGVERLRAGETGVEELRRVAGVAGVEGE